MPPRYSPRPSRRLRDPNRTGALGELGFAARVLELGLSVARPIGLERYDLLVDNGRRILRVQVKTARFRNRRNRAYWVPCEWGKRGLPYRPGQVDILAIHLAPARAWYLIPVRALAGRRCLALFPDVPQSRSRWERYRDDWELLLD